MTAISFADKPVLRHPHLWNKIDEAWGFIGGDVNLTCEVEANPPPKFEWYRKTHLITLKDRAIQEQHKSTLQAINNNLFCEKLLNCLIYYYSYILIIR